MLNIAVSIVERDTTMLQILAGWLRGAEGFQSVSEHRTAQNALAQLPQKNPDIALIDINLPRINDIECVRRLTPLLPETQFIVLTVYEDADHIFNALAAGAT